MVDPSTGAQNYDLDFNTGDADIPVTINDLGIPEEIKIIGPDKLPTIKHDLPSEILVRADLPDIKIIGPEQALPQRIDVIAHIPSQIHVVATEVPRSITVDAKDIPRTILVRARSKLPNYHSHGSIWHPKHFTSNGYSACY